MLKLNDLLKKYTEHKFCADELTAKEGDESDPSPDRPAKSIPTNLDHKHHSDDE